MSSEFDQVSMRHRLRHEPMAYVADLDTPILDDDDHHHLARSLRLNPGELITVSDGAGRWRTVRFGDHLDPVGPVEAADPARSVLTLGFVPVKTVKSETVVRALTELGIDRIVPLLSQRSVVRWDGERRRRQHQRHLKAVREAGMQSRRVRLPEVVPPCDLGSAELAAVEGDEAWSVADPGGQPLTGSTRAVLIGPEGGFDPDEVDRRPTVSLPGNILRAETAAVAAAALLADRRAQTV